MPKIKNWTLKFCYKIHEKLRLQRINSSPSHKINMGRTISKGFIWIFRRKNKKKEQDRQYVHATYFFSDKEGFEPPTL